MSPSPDDHPAADQRKGSSRGARAVAGVEVLLCSGYPTQLALASTLGVLGYRPFGPDGRLLVGYIVALSLLDTIVLLGLVLLFLRAHGDRPRDVFFGGRRAAREALIGLPLILIALVVGTAVLAGIQRFIPALHTVPHNPLEELLRTPRDAGLFALVAVFAGGVREELQRAFLLCRFQRWLGGGAIGVVVTSVAFGGGHLIQGADAAIATGLLGAFWGLIYLRRRSAVAPLVSHSGFNLMQIVQYAAVGR
jgi:membrane protease YdiL (CAAX protease family)